MIASSAARSSVSVSRRFVSSNRRAFSSATPMLEASVLSRRSSASSKASRLDRVSRPMTPRTRSPAEDRDAEPATRVAVPAELDRARARSRSSTVPERGRVGACPDDARGQPMPELDAGRAGSARPRRSRTGTRSLVAASYSADEHDLGVEHRPHPFADELDDRLEVELLASALPISLMTASSASRWSVSAAAASSRRTGARSRARRPCSRRACQEPLVGLVVARWRRGPRGRSRRGPGRRSGSGRRATSSLSRCRRRSRRARPHPRRVPSAAARASG